MNKFEKQLNHVSVSVRPWCLECPDFQDMLANSERYGTTPDGVAALALRQCITPPVERPTHHADGSKIEYWESQFPNCNLGKSKLNADAERYVREHGFKPLAYDNDDSPE